MRIRRRSERQRSTDPAAQPPNTDSSPEHIADGSTCTAAPLPARDARQEQGASWGSERIRVTGEQYNRFSYIVLFAGCVLGVVMAHTYTALGGCTLMLVAAVVGFSAPPIVRRLEKREWFIAEYGSYERFRARAREIVDYELLFRYRDVRSRGALIEFMMLHVPNMPRRYARHFVDNLTEDERPATLPPSAAPRKDHPA
jgi:hypothetical protein